MADGDLWSALNALRERLTRVETKQDNDREQGKSVERRTARLEMAIIAALVGLAYIVWQIVASNVGLPT